MKNKKGVSAIVATLILIVLVFVAVGIIYAVIINILEPHFKITKEECRNEMEIFEGKIEYFSIEEKINFTELDLNISGVAYILTKKICEQVEVERIEYKEGFFIYNGYGLTIEWLDESCEDITPCKTDYDGELICDNPTKTFRCGENYVVEVWNQIK